MFAAFVIDESLSCPPCKKMGLKVIEPLLERGQSMQKMLEKAKNVQDLIFLRISRE